MSKFFLKFYKLDIHNFSPVYLKSEDYRILLANICMESMIMSMPWMQQKKKP